MQSKTHSLIEASLNTLSGFIVSWLLWIFVAAPLFGILIKWAESFWLTVLFTVTSVIRSYFWRRLANWWQWKRRPPYMSVPEAQDALNRLYSRRLERVKTYIRSREDLNDR